MNIGVFRTGCLAVLAAFVGVGLPGCQQTNHDLTETDTLTDRSDRLVVELDNGLVVIAQEVPTAPVVSVQSWVETGSIYEGKYNGAGVSHFLEHLVSGGTTTNRTEEESNEILGRIGAQTNAATSLDTVRYYVNTSSEHTEIAIDLMSDWMLNSVITEEEFEREREVIQREFAMGDSDPGRIFWKLTQQARYQYHPARHPTIGYLDEFLELTRDDIYNFYRKMYVPNNMVFVVAGDIDKEAVVEQVRDEWGDAERQKLPGIVFPEEEPPGEPVEMTGEADIERPRLRLAWPGTRLGEEHDYALDLLGQILGQGELSRLAQTVRDEQGLATSVSAANASFSWGEGFFGIDATVVPDKVDEAREAILAQVERISRDGVTQEELARAKSKTVASVVYDSQTAQARASRLAGDFIHMADPDYLERYADEIQKVTAGDLLRAAREILRPEHTITVRLLPETEDSDRQPLAREEEEGRTTPGRGADVELVNLDNSQLVERMRQREDRGAVDVTPTEIGPVRMHTLPNGLRLITQRNTQLPIVAMQWYHLGGLLGEDPGEEGLANATMQMLKRGAGDRSADDIARQLESLGAQVSANSGNSTYYVSAQSLADDWQPVMDIMADVIQRPTFPEDEWDRIQPRLLAAIDSQDDQWHSELRNSFRANFFGEDHPWSSPLLGERSVVESLTVDRLRAYHAARFSASQGVLAVFGDIDEDEVVAAATEMFADLPEEPETPFEVPESPDVEPEVVQVPTNKPIAAVQIGYAPGIARQDEDYPAMLVMDRVMSSFPVGRFDRALRGEGPGLVYAVGSGLMTGVTGGYWAVLFNTQAETVGQAMQRSLQEVELIRNEPVDDATLSRARTAVLTREALGMQSNSQRATSAAIDELYGVGYDQSDALIANIRAVEADDVQQVAQEYLNSPLGVILINTSNILDEEALPSLTDPDDEIAEPADDQQPEEGEDLIDSLSPSPAPED